MTEGGLPLLVIPDLHLHAEVVIIIPLPPNEGITLGTEITSSRLISILNYGRDPLKH